ncbi:MAG: hypothetical protein IJF17_02245 [Thermoguttaceae bacterium]|nr:hypothetical protein [Thermoguttaceae bacterium]
MGIDDPRDSDLKGANIERSAIYYTNLVYDVTKFLKSGLLYAYFDADYRNLEPGRMKARTHAFEWMRQINF